METMERAVKREEILGRICGRGDENMLRTKIQIVRDDWDVSVGINKIETKHRILRMFFCLSNVIWWRSWHRSRHSWFTTHFFKLREDFQSIVGNRGYRYSGDMRKCDSTQFVILPQKFKWIFSYKAKMCESLGDKQFLILHFGCFI